MRVAVRRCRTTWPAAAGGGVSVLLLSSFAPAVGLLHAAFDPVTYVNQFNAIAAGLVPYRDFAFEYPPGALLSFAIPAMAAEHVRDDVFRALQVGFGSALIVALAVILTRLRFSPRATFALCIFCGAAPFLLGPVSLARFDLMPAMLVGVALALLLCGRCSLAFIALGLAIATKLYAIALIPVAMVYVWEALGWRRAVRSVALCLGTTAAIFAPFVAIAQNGVVNSLLTQSNRPLQIESIGASALLVAHEAGVYHARVSFGYGSVNLAGAAADHVAFLTTAALVVALAVVTLLFSRTRRTDADLAVAWGATLGVILALGKVFSPQYLLWLLPAALVPDRIACRATMLFVCAALLTRILYPGLYESSLLLLKPEGIWMLVARNAVVIALSATLLTALIRRRRAEGARLGSSRRDAPRRGRASS